MSERIYYHEGCYKYQLGLEYKLQLPFKPPTNILQKYLHLNVVRERLFTFGSDGLLTIKVGYAWDGPSGPTFDTSDSMRASLVHDVLYQMIGHKLLPLEFRDDADYLFYDILREDGMADFRAWAWCRAVRAFGEGPAVADEKPLKVAPVPRQPVIFIPVPGHKVAA